MKFKFLSNVNETNLLKKVIPILFVFAGFQANASLISSNVWHDTSGPVSGLLQSSFDDTIFYAQDGLDAFSFTDTYEAIAGYHFASHSEYAGLYNVAVSEGGYTPTTVPLHFDQGGWSGYTDNSGQTLQYYWAFSDVFNGVDETHDVAHSGRQEHVAASHQYDYATPFRQNLDRFAGFVLVKDNAAVVPEPSIIALFALGLVGIGFARRRRS
jgi:hypothetical protein